MKKKYIVIIIAILLSVGMYFLFFYKDKNLKYVPENADILILVDVKKATRQYVSSFLAHPSKWFEDGKKDKNKISVSDSGLEIPDFIQVFHLKDTKVSEWYCVLEINDKAKLSAFLKNRKFVNTGKDKFKNNQLFIKIEGEKCIVGTSDLNIKNIGKPLSETVRDKNLSADSFVNDGIGSISFISELRTQNFSIFINDDEIEIKNEQNKTDFSSLISDLLTKTQFLEVELNEESVKKIAVVFNKDLNDSISVNYLKMRAELAEVNDTIISYDYDENFNEIEKISYQKIVQPNYHIFLQTSDPDKTWNYFQSKKWINDQNQFTVIPFQTNLISKTDKQISIESLGSPLKLNENRKQNYIFIKNNALLYSSFKTLSDSDRKFFNTIEYIFYGNKNLAYSVKIKFKKDQYPLILR